MFIVRSKYRNLAGTVVLSLYHHRHSLSAEQPRWLLRNTHAHLYSAIFRMGEIERDVYVVSYDVSYFAIFID